MDKPRLSEKAIRELMTMGISGLRAMSLRVRAERVGWGGADLVFEFTDACGDVLVTICKATVGEGDTVTVARLDQPLNFTIS